jgi:hypothetical protein
MIHYINSFDSIFQTLSGELVSGTECLEYTHLFLSNESITRTKGNINYKEYQTKPSVSSDVMKAAQSMAKSNELKKMRPTTLRDQYMISNDKNDDSENDRISTINRSNKILSVTGMKDNTTIKML